VQAPRVRTTPASQADLDRRRRLILYAIAGSGIVALGIVLTALFALGSSGGLTPEKAAAAIRSGGCTYKAVPAALSGQHISSLKTAVKYNTFPPSNGRHYYTPAVWGFYDDAVNPKIAVHNEEHGGMIIWYGTGISATTKEEIRSFYDQDPNAILVTPLPTLGKNEIAMTAWTSPQGAAGEAARPGQGHVAICSAFNEKAFKAFRDAFRGHGPEGIPVAFNQPGT
jgi:hypothetical protein